MGCVLHRGQRGEGWCVSSTLCRYDIRMTRDVVLLVRPELGEGVDVFLWDCAEGESESDIRMGLLLVRRVSLGRESSEGEILGAC